MLQSFLLQLRMKRLRISLPYSGLSPTSFSPPPSSQVRFPRNLCAAYPCRCHHSLHSVSVAAADPADRPNPFSAYPCICHHPLLRSVPLAEALQRSPENKDLVLLCLPLPLPRPLSRPHPPQCQTPLYSALPQRNAEELPKFAAFELRAGCQALHWRKRD